MGSSGWSSVYLEYDFEEVALLQCVLCDCCLQPYRIHKRMRAPDQELEFPKMGGKINIFPHKLIISNIC